MTQAYGCTDVECKWPGSVHDAKVFGNSSINHKMKTGQLPKTFTTLLPGYEAIPIYLIGDPAYPLTILCRRSTRYVLQTRKLFSITCFAMHEIKSSALSADSVDAPDVSFYCQLILVQDWKRLFFSLAAIFPLLPLGISPSERNLLSL